MTVSNIVQVIAGLTGLAATIGGLWISYISFKYRADKDRPKIKIKMGKNKLINVPNTNPRIEYLTATVANVGKQNYTVTILGFALGKRSGGVVIPIPVGNVQVPHTLEEDKTCTFWTEYTGTKNHLKSLPWRKRKRMRIRAYVSDYSGRAFYSDWHKIDFEPSKFWKANDKLRSIVKDIRTFIFP